MKRLVVFVILVGLVLPVCAETCFEVLYSALEQGFAAKEKELEASSLDRDRKDSQIGAFHRYFDKIGFTYDAMCRRLAAANKPAASSLFRRGYEALMKGSIKKGLRILDEPAFIKSKPSASHLADLYFLKAVLHLCRFQLPEMDACFDKAFAAAPRDWELYKIYAHVSRCVEQWPRAAAIYYKLLNTDDAALDKTGLLLSFALTSFDQPLVFARLDDFIETEDDEKELFRVADYLTDNARLYMHFYPRSFKEGFLDRSSRIYGKLSKRNSGKYLDKYIESIVYLGQHLAGDESSQAVETVSEALRLLEANKKIIGDTYPFRLESVLYSLYFCYMTAERYEEARDVRLRSLNNYQLLKSDYPQAIQIRIAEIMTQLGGVENLLGNFEAAKDYYIKAADIYRTNTYLSRESGSTAAARIYRSLAQAFLQKKRFEEAIGYYSKSLAVHETYIPQTPFHYLKLAADDLANMAAVYDEAGDAEKSVAHYQRSAKNYETLIENHSQNRQLELAVILKKIASIHRAGGKLQLALDYLNRALTLIETHEKLYRQIGTHQLAATHQEIAEILTAMNRPQEADRHQQKAQNIHEQIQQYEAKINRNVTEESEHTLMMVSNF